MENPDGTTIMRFVDYVKKTEIKTKVVYLNSRNINRISIVSRV